MKEFIVKRSQWLRGGKDGNGDGAVSRLRNSDGHKCCLGHVLTQCGLREEDIDDKRVPSEIDKKLEGEFAFFRTIISENDKYLMNEAMRVNDEYGISDQEREDNLKAIFGHTAFTIKFID